MSRWSDAAERFHKEAAQWQDALPTRLRCSFCPDWIAEGTASEMRELATMHRRQHHPETMTWRRPRPTRNLKNFRPIPMDDLERSEIEDEKAKRAFLNGIEI